MPAAKREYSNVSKTQSGFFIDDKSLSPIDRDARLRIYEGYRRDIVCAMIRSRTLDIEPMAPEKTIATFMALIVGD